MAQTNYNKYICLTFDREVNSIDITQEYKAFTIKQTIRDSYHAKPYEKISLAISSQYAKDTMGLDVKSKIIIIFSDTDNFRKAEGDVNVIYDDSVGTLHGKYERDKLTKFEQTFTPQNIDHYQNPDSLENIKVNINSNCIPNIIKVKQTKGQSIESIKAKIQNNIVTTVTIVGTIKP